MKPTLCEQCIIQSTCTKSCIPHAHEANFLSHEIKKMKKLIFSGSGRRKKNIKDQHRKHYNAIVSKYNKSLNQGEIIGSRRFKKDNPDLFEDTFSGVDFADAGHKVSLEIDKMILKEVVEDAQNKT